MNLGGIIGGVIAGVVGAALITMGAILGYRYNKKRRNFIFFFLLKFADLACSIFI